MYHPQFTYTDRIVSLLLKCEKNKTRLENIDLSYPIKSKLQHGTSATEIVLVAAILDIEITLKEAGILRDGGSISKLEKDQETVLKNIHAALSFIRSEDVVNYPEIEHSVLQTINTYFVAELRENWDARYRTLNDPLDKRFEAFISYRDQEITSEQIDTFTNELIEWMKSTKPFMPNLVRLAIFSYRFIEIMPFIAGNSQTLILAIDYLLSKSDFGYKTYTSTYRFIYNAGESLVKALEISRRNYDMSTWIEFFVDAYNKELLRASEDISKFIENDEKSKQQPFLGLSKRQLKVLKYLQTVPTIQREDYCHMMEVSTMTAYRDLNDLVRKKLIKVDGKGRGTKYRLASM